jgi:hypothetical protein
MRSVFAIDLLQITGCLLIADAVWAESGDDTFTIYYSIAKCEAVSVAAKSKV